MSLEFFKTFQIAQLKTYGNLAQSILLKFKNFQKWHKHDIFVRKHLK